MIGRIKAYLKNELWPFVKYMITEPFIQLWEYLKDLFGGALVLKESKPWLYIFFITAGIFVILRMRTMALIFLGLFLLTVVRMELESGKWKEKQRERWKKKHEAELKETAERLKRERQKGDGNA